MEIKIIKLRESDNPRHANNIAEGFERVGKFHGAPVVGECFYVGSAFRSSTVQEILDEDTFRTHNSIYRWDFVKDVYPEWYKKLVEYYNEYGKEEFLAAVEDGMYQEEASKLIIKREGNIEWPLYNKILAIFKEVY